MISRPQISEIARCNVFEVCILDTEDRDFNERIIHRRLGARGTILIELHRLSNAAEADVFAEVVSNHADKLVGNPVVIEPERIRVSTAAMSGEAATHNCGRSSDITFRSTIRSGG